MRSVSPLTAAGAARTRRLLATLRALPGGARTLWRGLGLVAATAPLATGAYLALVLVGNLTPVAQVWFAKVVVDRLAAGMAADALGEPAWRLAVLVPAALYVLALVVSTSRWPAQNALAGQIQERATVEIDRRLMAAGIRMVDLTRIERPAFQDEWRFAQNAHTVPPTLVRVVEQGIGQTVIYLGYLVLLAGLHPLIPVALLLLTAPQIHVSQRLTRQVHEAMAQRTRAGREMDYCAQIATEPAAAKELRVFDLGGFFLQRFRERYHAALREITALRLRELRSYVALGSPQALAVAFGFWYVAAQAQAGRLGLGDVTLYIASAGQAVGVMWLAQAFGFAYDATLRLRSFFTVVDGARPGIALPRATNGFDVPASLRDGIAFRGVRFTYPEGTEPVLDGVDALLPAGKVTALVGANGAGKSTLVKLLTRMYDPLDGDILLDGRPLAAYDLRELRRSIAVTYQDFARFSLTLGENVAVGAVNGHDVSGRVAQAAQWAGADELAARLPLGYETPLTRRFEGGVELSGGEWQKVALARTFVREAALVVLDEPTAALDAEAEYQLFQRFRELVAGKTALLISHRFSTVRMADQILVLEHGQIVEAGSHDDLVARGGRYASLYEMQAGRYR